MVQFDWTSGTNLYGLVLPTFDSCVSNCVIINGMLPGMSVTAEADETLAHPVSSDQRSPWKAHDSPGRVRPFSKDSPSDIEEDQPDAGRPARTAMPTGSPMAIIGDRGGVRKGVAQQLLHKGLSQTSASWQSAMSTLHSSSFGSLSPRDRNEPQESAAARDGEDDSTEDESADDSALSPLFVPIVHILWYLLILYVSMNMMWAWMDVYMGSFVVKAQIERLVLGSTASATSTASVTFASPEQFLYWVATTLLVNLSPPQAQSTCPAAPANFSASSFPSAAPQVTAHAHPAPRNTAVLLYDEFDATDTTLWDFNSVDVNFCEWHTPPSSAGLAAGNGTRRKFIQGPAAASSRALRAKSSAKSAVGSSSSATADSTETWTSGEWTSPEAYRAREQGVMYAAPSGSLLQVRWLLKECQ